jgi:serine/threonine protein kinase
MTAAPPGLEGIPATPLWQRAKEIKAGWQAGAGPNANAALRAEPALEADKVVLCDLAYEEYRLRRDAGERIDPDAFCERFPNFRSSLRRMLNVDRVVLGSDAPSLSGYLLGPERWPEPGERVGDYTLVRELGRGGFARVFLATEASTGDRPVVVKLSSDPRTEQEAQMLGRLSHPNVVPILSCRQDESAGLTIVCMPFLGSATLEDVRDRVHRVRGDSPRRAVQLLEAARALGRPDDPPVPEGPPDPVLLRGSYTTGVLHLGARLAEVLAFLHGRGVFHRDLKPSNVLLGPDGCPRLLDFNLSCDRGADAALLGGTLEYAAPEHIRAMLREPDAGQPDARSDLFALGVILYQMLTGRHPFGHLSGDSSPRERAEMLLQRHQAGCPLPEARGLGPKAARLVGRCLAADPAQRPTAVELAAGLREAVGPGRLRRWAARHRRPVLALVCLVPLVLGAALAGFRDPSPPPSADQQLAFDAGIQHYNAGQYGEAAKDFANTLLADPNDTRSRLYHGFALLGQSRGLSGPDERSLVVNASVDFDQLRSDNPTTLVRACLAYCWTMRDLHMQALDLTADDAETAGATPALLNNRACSFLQRAELDAAERMLARIPGNDRLVPEVCYNHAILAQLRRRQSASSSRPTVLPPRVLEDIEQVLQRWPQHWEPNHDAGKLYAYAAEDNGRALAILSGLPPLASALLSLRESQMQEAIQHFRFVLNQLPATSDPEKNNTLQAAKDRALLVLNGCPDCKALQGLWIRPPAPRSLTLRLVNPAPDHLD